MPFNPIFLVALAALWTVYPHTVHAQCYYPDGQTLTADLPCNSSATVSPCCGAGAQCLDNGLCYGRGIVSRGSCTDKSWGEGCAQYCQNVDPSGGMPLQPCDPFSIIFSCGINTTNCLTDTATFVLEGGTNFILRDVVNAQAQTSALEIAPTTTIDIAAYTPGQNTVPVLSASTYTVTATMPATTSSTDSMDGTNNPASRFTAADVAGAAVGTGAPLLLALLAAIYIVLNQRKKLREFRRESSGRQLDYHSPTRNTNVQAPSMQSVSPLQQNWSIAEHKQMPYNSYSPQQSYMLPARQLPSTEAPLVEASADGERQELAGYSRAEL